MDNAQKAIMIGVGLFITIIIISAVLLITNMGSSTINKSATELGTISDSTQNQIIKDYDGKMISSTEALELIKKYYAGKDGVSIFFTNDIVCPYPPGAASIARVGAKYIWYTYNYTTIGTAKRLYASFSPSYVYVYAFNGSYSKTSLSDFSNNTNQFYIAPGVQYKTSIVYMNNTYTSVVGIAIQKAS